MMVGLKFRRTPYSLKMMVIAVAAAAALNYRNRKFAAGEEARLLAVHRDQIWFRQFAQRALCLQHANHGRGVDPPIEDEQIKRG